MAKPKEGVATNGEQMHYSEGAMVQKDGNYLLIDRAVPPLGFAGVAGHVDENEDPEQSLLREVEEEVGLKITDRKLLFEEELDWNWCSKGVDIHYWYLFGCTVIGELKRSERETKSAGWYTPEEIKGLTLEPVWDYWFKKMKII